MLWCWNYSGQRESNAHTNMHAIVILKVMLWYQPENGFYRAQKTGQKEISICYVAWFVNVVLRFYGVLIIPKWLLNDS